VRGRTWRPGRGDGRWRDSDAGRVAWQGGHWAGRRRRLFLGLHGI